MGCCKSSPNQQKKNSLIKNSSLTKDQMNQLETFLSEIPDHCRSSITNIPARQLFIFYQCHTIAKQHGKQKEWSLAISYERCAIKGLQSLLPKDKDHYIFYNFYSILSASLLALGELEAAIEGIHITLAILLKHTPMNYNTISNHYYHLANAYKILHDWKATAQYLQKALELTRLIDDPDEEFLQKVETELQIAQGLSNFTSFEITRKRGENDHDFRRRMTAASISLNVKQEFNNLHNKQTELHAIDED